jgi:voltage-gated sodium channel
VRVLPDLRVLLLGVWRSVPPLVLTLFVMLTLEDFPVYMDDAMEVYPWAWLYFVSFILVAAFIVLNVLIGIVLNSMEEARELERRQAIRDAHAGRGRPGVVDPEAHAHVVERIAILRTALDDLELQLALESAPPEESQA